MKKKMTTGLTALMIVVSSFAQNSSGNASWNNDKYFQAMDLYVKTLDTASNQSTLLTLANSFSRIATAEKKEWLPFYYASYCYALLAFAIPDKSKTDMLADKAEDFLKQADLLSKNNSEISCLYSMIISTRILVDPMSRWQSMGPQSAQYLEKSKIEDPQNPRPYFLEANTKLRTPESLGGGKAATMPIIEEAVRKFETFKPESTISPHWGKEQAQKLLQQLSK